MIKVETVPKQKEEKDSTIKIQGMVEDRNKIISKRFNMEAQDIEVTLHFSRAKLLTDIRNSGESLGIYCGYAFGRNNINLIHPHMVKTIFKENLDKEFLIMIDYCLTKFYAHKKYFAEKEEFKLYFKYLTEEVAKITSGNFRTSIVKFDMRSFVDGRRYTKDKELDMLLFIMLEKSGIDYIFEHLDKMFEDKDIKKTIFTIYKKSMWDLIEPYKKEEEEIARKIQQKFRRPRR